MAAEYVVRHGDGAAPWSPAIDPVMIRTLFKLQSGCCALLGVLLRIPDDSVSLNPRETLKKWIDTLPPDQADRTPVLVRVSAGAAWEPGSVVLISKMAEPIYRSEGSIGKALDLMHKARMHPVPTPETLRVARLEMEAVMYGEWRQERKRIKDEERQNEEADKELERKDPEAGDTDRAEVP